MAKYLCPECHVPLTKAEFIAGVCPVCARPTIAHVSAAATAPRRRSAGQTAPHAAEWFSPAWHHVQRGLHLITSAFLIVVAGGAFGLLAGFLLVAIWYRRMPLRVLGSPGMISLSLLIFVPAVLLNLIGMLMCCAAPRGTAARRFALGTVFCFLSCAVIFVLFGLQQFIGHRGQGRNASTLFLLILLAIMLFLVGYALFFLFLRAVADFFHNQTLAKRCLIYLIYCLFFLLGILAALVYFFVFSRQPQLGRMLPLVARLLVGGGVIVGCWMMLLWQIRILRETRDTVRRAIGIPANRDEY